MTKAEIVNKVKSLNLPADSYVVYGGAPLAVAGIREANDIDIVVTPGLLLELRERGWKELYKGPNDAPLVFDVFEAHDNWNFGHYNPSLKDLIKNSQMVEGIPFASIQDVRKWKEASARPKDLADLKLMSKYLEKVNKPVDNSY